MDYTPPVVQRCRIVPLRIPFGSAQGRTLSIEEASALSFALPFGGLITAAKREKFLRVFTEHKFLSFMKHLFNMQRKIGEQFFCAI